MTVISEVVNVSKVPQRSPFRYPGGKTWFVPQFREWISSLRVSPVRLIEPFAGGAVISLTSVAERLSQEVAFSEIDPNVASVWTEILETSGEDLCDKILGFDMNFENARKVLAQQPQSNLDQAFQTIVRNRVNRGGILSKGASFVRSGENGRGLKSRWYPETLVRRIRNVAEWRDEIEFVQADWKLLVDAYGCDPQSAFFIDPPYTAGGKNAGRRLYNRSSLDHVSVFESLSKVSGPVLMTYSDSPEVRELATSYDFRIYQVPMKSTHHAKLYELALVKA